MQNFVRLLNYTMYKFTYLLTCNAIACTSYGSKLLTNSLVIYH